MRPRLCETGRTARRCHEASVIRSMSGNGSVRKKVDLIWSVVPSSGDSALECDRECVQGWFRALCLSNTSRTPPWSGLSDKRKGIYEASRCQARSTRLVHIDTAAWRPQEGRLTVGGRPTHHRNPAAHGPGPGSVCEPGSCTVLSAKSRTSPAPNVRLPDWSLSVPLRHCAAYPDHARPRNHRCDGSRCVHVAAEGIPG
jgi:hypothetical protein